MMSDKAGRGGKREGAGPKFSDPANPLDRRFTVILNDAQWERLDAVLKGLGSAGTPRKRSEFARQCILAGIEQEEIRAGIYKDKG